MIANGLLVGVLTVGGIVVTGAVMALCARLAGVERPTPRNSVIAAAGFGLPLVAAASLLRTPGQAAIGLVVAIVAAVLGVIIIRLAYTASLGQALIVWVMNVCVWVLLSSVMIRMRS